MGAFLTPGYLRWDGLKFVTDPNVEIVGPSGPPGPPGPPGPSAPIVISIPTRGLTTQLFASATDGYVPTGAIKTWWDLAPARSGQYWQSTPSATYNGSGFNGVPTYDFTEAAGALFKTNNISFSNFDQYVKPHEFTFAATLLYNGTKSFATTQVCPQIINETGPSNPHKTCGLSVGIDSGSAIFFSVHVNDTNGVSTSKLAKSVSLSGTVPHYVIGTFGSGVLTLYVDNLTPVTTSGVGDMVLGSLQGTNVAISGNSTSTSETLQAKVQFIAAWNVALTADEIVQLQATMRKQGNF